MSMPQRPLLPDSRLLEPPPKTLHSTFNPAIHIEIEGQELSTNLGVIALREADHRLGFTEALANALFDGRKQKAVRYVMQELLLERIGAMLSGNPTQDALDRQAHDPATRSAAWRRPGARVADERLASQPTASRLQDALAEGRNLEILRSSAGDLVARHCFAAGRDRKVKTAALDVDAFPVIGYGKQEGLVYNDHYREKVFLPLIASFAPNGHYDSSRQGDGIVRAQLYGGLPKTAAERLDFIRQAFPAAEQLAECVILRADAEFATLEEMNALGGDKRYFVMRHANAQWIRALGEPFAARPPGRPPSEGYHHVVDLGSSRWHPDWERPLRIIVCVEDGPDKSGQLSLAPRVFFLVANVPDDVLDAEAALDFYRQRGTFESRLGEWNAVVGTNLSSKRLAENDATLQLACLAFNFANLLRGELEAASDPRPDPPANQAEGMGLARFQEVFLQAAGALERRGRRLFFKVSRGLGAWWLALWNRFERWNPSMRFPIPSPVYARPWVAPPRHSFHWFRPRL
jgi:hypothetical protein